MKKITSSFKSFAIIIHKLSYDILFLGLLGFMSLVLIEAVFPGMISSRINLSLTLISLLAVIIFIDFLGRKFGFEKISLENKKMTYLLIAILSIFSFLLLRQTNIVVNAISIILIITISLYFYKLFTEQD